MERERLTQDTLSERPDYLPDDWGYWGWEDWENIAPITDATTVVLIACPNDISDDLGKKITSSHVEGLSLNDKSVLADRTWALFELCYEYIGGFKSYASAQDMGMKADYIFAIYDGKLDNIRNFNVDKCYCIMCFENKHGLKVMGGATNPFLEKQKVMSAWRKINRYAMKIGWCEVSGKAEKYIAQTGAPVIDPHIIKNRIYPNGNVEILSDGKHYRRDASFGRIEKVAYGKIKP